MSPVPVAHQPARRYVAPRSGMRLGRGFTRTDGILTVLAVFVVGLALVDNGLLPWRPTQSAFFQQSNPAPAADNTDPVLMKRPLRAADLQSADDPSRGVVFLTVLLAPDGSVAQVTSEGGDPTRFSDALEAVTAWRFIRSEGAADTITLRL